MAERVKVREREKESTLSDTYEMVLYQRRKFAEQQMTGKVVIRDSDREWEACKNGRVKYFLQPFSFDDHALRDWFVFAHDIRKHSGMHKHQGGSVVIYVIEGKGYTVVDGARYDWEEGDLLLLPHKPGGVEHQHFNSEPGKGCKWIAFIYLPYHNMLASVTTQLELSPEYRPKL